MPHRLQLLCCKLARAFAVAGLATVLAGCETVRNLSVTAKLWDTRDFSQTATPASPAHLQILESNPGGRLLVRYDEYSERHERVRPRAYWLAENRERIRAGKPPKFVEVGPAAGLRPLLGCTNATECADRATFARTAYAAGTNGQSFVLCRPGLVDGPFDLPSYDESGGTAVKVALTPLAVAGDAVIVGIGGIFIGAYLWAQGWFYH